MATNVSISPAKAQEIMKRADGAMAKLQKIRGKTEEKVGEVFKMVETVGGALAVGYARAKWGEVTVGPEIPIEALVGAGLSLSAFLDLPGKYSEHLHNLGNGILGGWGTMEAVKLGGGIVLSKKEFARLQAAQSEPLQKKENVHYGVQGEVTDKGRQMTGGTRSAREVFETSESREKVSSGNS